MSKKKLLPTQQAVMSEWLSKSDIPNTEGFNLLVKLTGGKIVAASVEKDATSCCHFLAVENQQIAISSVIGWKHILQ